MQVISILRSPEETDFDYHKRLVYGKLVDKTLADCDYTELAELVYGQHYSSDVARRMMYGSRKTLELMDESRSNLRSPSCGFSISEIDLKLAELKQERQRCSDQRREMNKLLAQDARRQHICDALIDAAYKISEKSTCLMEFNNPTDPTNNILTDNASTEAVLVLSDWHYGMVTSNVFNTYNTDICKARLNKIVNSAIKKLKLHKCRKLHIVVLGDLIHGAIHTSARVASEELVCDQLMQVSEILALTVLELSKYVAETAVHITYGNHARVIPNKQDSIHRDNFERVIPWWLQQRLQAYSNITVEQESNYELLLIDACGHNICATHGDLDSVKSSPTCLTTLIRQTYGTDVECILLGDKHHRESFEAFGTTAIICGSLCGTDDYANEKRLYSTPEQLMLIVDPKTGVDAEYHLKC